MCSDEYVQVHFSVKPLRNARKFDRDPLETVGCKAEFFQKRRFEKARMRLYTLEQFKAVCEIKNIDDFLSMHFGGGDKEVPQEITLIEDPSEGLWYGLAQDASLSCNPKKNKRAREEEEEKN